MYDPKYDPLEHLDRLGVRVIAHTLNECSAAWIPERRIVLVDRHLCEEDARPVLAHECSHAEHGDPGGHHPRHEARANLESARRLINPREWDALTATLSDYDRICLELGINRGQFLAYRDHRARMDAALLRLERVGNAIYCDPKMGAGQWTMKLEAV